MRHLSGNLPENLQKLDQELAMLKLDIHISLVVGSKELKHLYVLYSSKQKISRYKVDPGSSILREPLLP